VDACTPLVTSIPFLAENWHFFRHKRPFDRNRLLGQAVLPEPEFDRLIEFVFTHKKTRLFPLPNLPETKGKKSGFPSSFFRGRIYFRVILRKHFLLCKKFLTSSDYRFHESSQ